MGYTCLKTGFRAVLQVKKDGINTLPVTKQFSSTANYDWKVMDIKGSKDNRIENIQNKEGIQASRTNVDLYG